MLLVQRYAPGGFSIKAFSDTAKYLGNTYLYHHHRTFSRKEKYMNVQFPPMTSITRLQTVQSQHQQSLLILTDTRKWVFSELIPQLSAEGRILPCLASSENPSGNLQV